MFTKKTYISKCVFVLLLCAFMLSLSACRGLGNKENSPIASPMKKVTLQYKSIENVAQNLLSLDIYYKDDFRNKPVVFFVHGGSLLVGDKANENVYKAKSEYFTENGYIFVSVNYRLSPAAMYPAHITDIADAFMYIYKSIEKYGGDKGSINIMGHSAGAHMVSLLATNEKYITQAGGSFSLMKACVSLDTEQYNTATEDENYVKTIGTSKELIDDAAPLKHVESSKGIPPFLTFYGQGRERRMELQQPFIDKLKSCFVPAACILASGDTHEDVNAEIGTSGDKKTKIIMEFFANPQDVEKIAQKYNFRA
jgi:acetyl esterase/lipase